MNEKERKLIEEALRKPHDAQERFDPDFPISFRCSFCGRLGHGPRSQLQDALREHRETCPARYVKVDDPLLMRILYPRQ